LERDHDCRCPNPPVWASPLDQLQHQRNQWKPEQRREQKSFQTIKHPRLHGSRVETESVFEFELGVPREWQTDDAEYKACSEKKTGHCQNGRAESRCESYKRPRQNAAEQDRDEEHGIK
jgi:hypothetical protein